MPENRTNDFLTFLRTAYLLPYSMKMDLTTESCQLVVGMDHVRIRTREARSNQVLIKKTASRNYKSITIAINNRRDGKEQSMQSVCI